MQWQRPQGFSYLSEVRGQGQIGKTRTGPVDRHFKWIKNPIRNKQCNIYFVLIAHLKNTCFFVVVSHIFVEKVLFFKLISQECHQSVEQLDPDQARHIVWPDQDPNCSQRQKTPLLLKSKYYIKLSSETYFVFISAKNCQRKIINIFLPIIFNICFRCSKELSH